MSVETQTPTEGAYADVWELLNVKDDLFVYSNNNVQQLIYQVIIVVENVERFRNIEEKNSAICEKFQVGCDKLRNDHHWST